MRVWVFVLIFLFPISASAEIIISEIAWMGDSSSHTNEWIEVYNSGDSSVDLSTWKITASDGTPDISLFGSIASGEYKVFRRSDGDYSGALSNSGETLKLANSSGVVSTIVGGTDWSNIGGDNTTKETAQYNGTSWFTTTPTPGSGSISNEEDDDTEEVVVSSSEEVSKDIEVDIVVSTEKAVVGMPIKFKGYKDYVVSDSVSGFNWNFGDGSVGRGPVIHHTYTQPGSYVVSLNYSGKGKDEAKSRVIEVFEPGLSIEVSAGNYIEITSNSNVKIDVSGWSLRNNIDGFYFPPGSYIAPKAKLRLDADTITMENMSHIDLVDKNNSVAATYPGKKEVVPDSFYNKVQTTKTTRPAEEKEQTENVAAVGLAGIPEKEGDNWGFWISALLLVIVLASGAVFLGPKKINPESLIEDDIDVLE